LNRTLNHPEKEEKMRADPFEGVPTFARGHAGCTLTAEPVPEEFSAGEPCPFPAGHDPEHSTLGLVELLLKAPARVDALHGEADRQTELVPRFLGIALAGYTLFALAMILLLNAAVPAAYPQHLLRVPSAGLGNGSALGLWFGYALGLIAANGVCLPSFYFFGLLSGVRLSTAQIAVIVLRGGASNAVLLVGILPIYVAVVLGLIVLDQPAAMLEAGLYLGLALPFLAGTEGVRAVYRGMTVLAGTLPLERRERRTCFLRRLTLAWAVCYSVVAPVMIYRLWECFAGALA
jgi:hypothetical protein